MIEAIIFDLDETIHDRTATLRRFLVKQYRLFELSEHLSERSFIDRYMTYQQNGCVAAESVYERFSSELNYGGELRDSLISDYRSDFGSVAIPFPNAVEVLKNLSKDYRLGMITNGSAETQNRKIDSLEIRGLFRSIKISGEEGVKKPEREIFLRCLSELETKPEKSIFIGDNPDDDVMAAKFHGFRTIWMRSAFFAQPESCDEVVDRFSEIPTTIRLIAEQISRNTTG